MCVQGVWEKRPTDIHTVMSNFAKLNSSWLVQSIRKVLRMVSVILVNVLIVSPLNKNFENAKHVLFDQKNKRRHFKGVKEARKEGALGLQILSQENISCHRKKFPVTGTIFCQRKKFHLKRQNFKLQEEIFSDKKKFPVTDRKFLLKEIIIYQRKKFSAFIKRLTKLNQYFVLMTHCQ